MKILYHGDSPAVTTGFGTVAKNLLDGLVRINPEIDITVLGINDHGGWKNPNDYPYRIYPAVFTDAKDSFGFKRLISIIQGTDPEIPFDFDVILFSFDSWLFANTTIGDYTVIQKVKELLAQKEAETGKHVKTVIYTPIDNHQILPGWIDTLKVFDEVVVPSQFGKKTITRHDKDLGDRTRVIYNGLDTKNFYPLEKKIRTIKDMYEFDINGKFVIGFVGRNSWRKNYFHLVKIFSLFHEKHPDAFLYMHCAPVSYEHDGLDLLELCKYYGLEWSEDYYIPMNHKEGAGIKRQSMNEVYNTMDVFLSTSVGEGFGLPYIEAMLAGVPVILPDNTTTPEFLSGLDWKEMRGFSYVTNNSVCFGSYDLMRERPLPDIDEALEKLELVYNAIKKQNVLQIDKITAKAREFSLTITAEKMAKQFMEVLK